MTLPPSDDFAAYSSLAKAHTHLAWITLAGDPHSRLCDDYLQELVQQWLALDTARTGVLPFDKFLELCDALCASPYDWDLTTEDRALLPTLFGGGGGDGEGASGGGGEVTFREFLFWSESEQGMVIDAFSTTSVDVFLDEETGHVVTTGAADLAYAPSADICSFTFLPWDAPTTRAPPLPEPYYLGLLHLNLDVFEGATRSSPTDLNDKVDELLRHWPHTCKEFYRERVHPDLRPEGYQQRPYWNPESHISMHPFADDASFYRRGGYCK
eukprot:g4717.t1